MSRKARPLIVLAVLWLMGLAALAVFHLAFVGKRTQALVDCRKQAAVQAEQFSFLRNARSARQQGQLKAKQEEAERQYGDFVFTTDDLSGLDFKIREIAERNGLADFSCRHVGTSTKTAAGQLKRIAERDLVLSFSGDFPGFLHFVNELERNQPIVVVDQFTVQNATGKQGGLTCTLECCVLYQANGK